MTLWVKASAPARVCFAGEDIDWILGPSLLGAIDLRLEVVVRRLADDSGFVVLKSGEPFNVERKISISSISHYEGHILDYVQAALKVIGDHGVNIYPLEISVFSQVPPQVGLASSAAVTVAALAALAAFHGMDLTNKEICHLAYLVESEELKTGAGQMDFYVTGLGGFLYLDSATVPPNPLERFTFPADIGILIADTGAKRLTANVISSKRERLHRLEPRILDYVRYTSKTIGELHHLLTKPKLDLATFGALISSCHRYLDEYMGVSTPSLNDCVRTCLANGALGAKLTGTGMGGCMFALVPKETIEATRDALASLPVRIYTSHISNSGVFIEHPPVT